MAKKKKKLCVCLYNSIQLKYLIFESHCQIPQWILQKIGHDACLALSSINFRRSLNRKKERAYTLHKPVRSLFIQIGWSNAEMENQSIDWQNSSFSYNVSQHIKTHIKTKVKNNRKVYQGIALKRLLKMYFMLAILSKNKTKLVLLTQTVRICSENLTC